MPTWKANPSVGTKRSWHVWMSRDNVTPWPHFWFIFADEHAGRKRWLLWVIRTFLFDLIWLHQHPANTLATRLQECRGLTCMFCSHHACMLLFLLKVLCCLCSYHVSSWSVLNDDDGGPRDNVSNPCVACTCFCVAIEFCVDQKNYQLR